MNEDCKYCGNNRINYNTGLPECTKGITVNENTPCKELNFMKNPLGDTWTLMKMAYNEIQRRKYEKAATRNIFSSYGDLELVAYLQGMENVLTLFRLPLPPYNEKKESAMEKIAVLVCNIDKKCIFKTNACDPYGNNLIFVAILENIAVDQEYTEESTISFNNTMMIKGEEIPFEDGVWTVRMIEEVIPIE